MHTYFLTTDRLGFSKWSSNDLALADSLWGNYAVTKYICASGHFTKAEIKARLETEILNDTLFSIQYWPFFDLHTGEFMGCCGVRPFQDQTTAYEMGFYIKENYWGCGCGYEAANAVIQYCFSTLHIQVLYAGHHPQNTASKKLLTKLGFHFIGENYYEPTKLFHPSYKLINPQK